MASKKKSWNWSAIFIAFILVSSTFAVTLYGFTAENESKRYNGYKFTQINGGWQAKVNGNPLFFNFPPDEVDHIAIDHGLQGQLRTTPEIDVTSSINDTNAGIIALSQVQLEQVLALSNVYIRRGFDTNTSYNLPIIQCHEMAYPLLYFQTGLNTSIYPKDGCTIIEGASSQDLLKLKDRLLYAYFGIIQ